MRLASEDDEQESPVVSLTTGDSPLSTSAEEEDPLTPRAPLALTPDPRVSKTPTHTRTLTVVPASEPLGIIFIHNLQYTRSMYQ